MSFSSECKMDIIAARRKDCCELSFLYGVLMFSPAFSQEEVVISAPSEEMLDGILSVYSSLGYDRGAGEMRSNQRSCSFRLTHRDSIDRLFFDFGHTGEEQSLRVQDSAFLCGGCPGAFISGAFVAAGSVCDPRSGYHMEFSTHRQGLFSDLCRLLESQGFVPGRLERGYSKVAYFKESGRIEDLLTFMGASDGAMKLMDLKIYKEIVNNVNRRLNCESANIVKTVAAAQSDAEDINLILSVRGPESLGEELGEIARLRLQNPELSLSELGELCETRLSKSGVSHRLARIRAMARMLREEQHAEA